MIDSILKPFYPFQQLPIDTQYWIATGVFGGLLIMAAILREMCEHKPTKIAGCIIGAVAFFYMSAFSHHLVGIIDQKDALLSARVQQSREIATSHKPQIEIKFSNNAGTTVSFGVNDDGLRAVSATDNRRMGSDFPDRSGSGRLQSELREPESRILRDDVRGMAAMGRLHERAAEWWARISGAAAGSAITPKKFSPTF